jgi:hypothetical protein
VIESLEKEVWNIEWDLVNVVDSMSRAEEVLDKE